MNRHHTVTKIFTLTLWLAGMSVVAPFLMQRAWANPTDEGSTPALSRQGLHLLGDFYLNGRFDLNYERVKYTDDLTKGQDAFRNYHHFLFLSRRSPNDPFTFSVELTELMFYEMSYRYQPASKTWWIIGKLGKILVPFGPEPRFHSHYGGLSGFDQTFLPVVWSQHGVTAQGMFSYKDWNFTADLFLVQGYKLAKPDGVLNLQSDFSPIDDVNFGVGTRIGVSWKPISLWYSFYVNGLDFGRTLVMQALDLNIWRPVDLPVLRNITVSVGAIRADVSGGKSKGYGGPGKDYYHFANYFQFRYYPLRWLYLQYRNGLHTVNNRRGWYIDSTRLDEHDMSTHNLGIVARYRGLSGGVFHFWKLEKRNELDNDVFRVTVSYEF